MANWKLIGGITGAVLALGAIGNAIDGDTTTSTPATPPAGQQSPTSTPAGDAKAGTPKKKPVPDFAGMGLQSAQDTAQEAGFYNLTSHDSLGRARMQAFDRNWKVCSQKPSPGKTATANVEVDFGAVKLGEDCPAKDRAEPSAAEGKMPDFAGGSVKAARGALDSNTSITVTDASGGSRFVLMESNWKVCVQEPAAGARLSGKPVELTAVKFEEDCP